MAIEFDKLTDEQKLATVRFMAEVDDTRVQINNEFLKFIQQSPELAEALADALNKWSWYQNQLTEQLNVGLEKIAEGEDLTLN